MAKALIALGSNLGDRHLNITTALEQLNLLPNSKIIKISKFYQTKPVGYLDQGDFINAAIQLKTTLAPLPLLTELQLIEKKLGRTREVHWGPRTIDLDILTYDQLILTNKHLTIPHPRISERAFVLRPLCDIVSQEMHPTLQKSYQQLLTEVEELDGDNS